MIWDEKQRKKEKVRGVTYYFETDLVVQKQLREDHWTLMTKLKSADAVEIG